MYVVYIDGTFIVIGIFIPVQTV